MQDAFLDQGVNPILGVELRGLDVIGFTRVLPGTTVAPPVLTNALVKGTTFQFSLMGGIGSSYIVQSSGDLQTWTPLSTNAIPASGSTNLTIPSFASNPRRFYRAISQ